MRPHDACRNGSEFISLMNAAGSVLFASASRADVPASLPEHRGGRNSCERIPSKDYANRRGAWRAPLNTSAPIKPVFQRLAETAGAGIGLAISIAAAGNRRAIQSIGGR